MITIKKKIYFARGAQGRTRIMDKPPPAEKVPEGRVPRLSRLMALALLFDDLIRSRRCTDMGEIARICMVTQPRITQVMNLLHLAPDIQEELLFLPLVDCGRDPIHEKRMRKVCQEADFAHQRRLWEVLKRSSSAE
ncbi:MAG: hypothetical protein LC104_07695 [Bacteroidales bacterium]|nr:hypothetical protein [Bacteroidales bacterium]